MRSMRYKGDQFAPIMASPMLTHMDSSIEAVPGRVFLDTNVVNFILEFGSQIHDGAKVLDKCSPRVRSDIEALSGIFLTGQRATWQLAISPHTYREVTATEDQSHANRLESWFFQIWHYWREFLHSDASLPTFSEAEEIRLQLLSSDVLNVLPDTSDRVLVCDAVVYGCDAFCTRDWSTVLSLRDELQDLPTKILTPTEWWSEIRPWAGIWV